MQALIPLEGMTFGCDPELFITNEEGLAVSPEDFLPGTKDKPYKVADGAVQVDGMAAEFNTNPAKTFEEFDHNITSVMADLKKMLPKGYKFDISPSMVFSKEVFEKASSKAKELGCSPDYNAWDGDVNPPPDASLNPLMRCAGGHLHIGWTDGENPGNLQHVMNCSDLVKQLDWFLGLWSVDKDADNVRRQLYGKAGACRIKPYGVEYRVLSNFWIKDKKIRLETWNRMVEAISCMRNFYMPDAGDKLIRGYRFNPLVVKSINDGKVSKTLKNVFEFPIKRYSESYEGKFRPYAIHD